MTRTIQITISLDQAKETLRGLRLRRENLEHYNPLGCETIKQIEDMDMELTRQIIGVPATL